MTETCCFWHLRSQAAWFCLRAVWMQHLHGSVRRALTPLHGPDQVENKEWAWGPETRLPGSWPPWGAQQLLWGPEGSVEDPMGLPGLPGLICISLSSTLEFRPSWPLWAESCCWGPQASSCPPCALNIPLTVWLIPAHPFTLASGSLSFISMHLLPSFKVLTTVQELSAYLPMSLHLAISVLRANTPLNLLYFSDARHDKKLLRTYQSYTKCSSSVLVCS